MEVDSDIAWELMEPSLRKTVIMFWNKPWRGWDTGDNSWIMQYCAPGIQCSVIYKSKSDREYPAADASIKKADAIVFKPYFSNSLPINKTLFNSYRNKNQIFALLDVESPYFHQNHYKTEFDGFFNATINYRMDATFPFPYGSMAGLKLRYYYDVKSENAKSNWERSKFTKKDFRDLKDSDLAEFWSERQIPVKTHGVVVIVSNGRSEFRNRGIKKLDELVRFENGTKALDVFGEMMNRLQPEPSPFKIDIKSDVGRSTAVGYHRLRKKVEKYKFYSALE